MATHGGVAAGAEFLLHARARGTFAAVFQHRRADAEAKLKARQDQQARLEAAEADWLAASEEAGG